MTVRSKRGRLRVVSTPQSVAGGRPTRSRPEPGAEQSVPAHATLGLALGIEEVAVACATTRGERTAAWKRRTRRRHELRRAVSPAEAQRLEAAAKLGSLDLAATKELDATSRARMLEGFARGVACVEQHGLTATTAMVHAFRAARVGALCDAVLDRAAGKLDEAQLRLATSLAAQARLELLAALEAERRARLSNDRTDSGEELSGDDAAFLAELRGRTSNDEGDAT